MVALRTCAPRAASSPDLLLPRLRATAPPPQQRCAHAHRTALAAAMHRRAAHATFAALSPAGAAASQRRRHVLMFDVMDTLVADPFYAKMPAFFGMSFKELLAAKHPTAWVDFERGALEEAAFLARFFADGRAVDGAALRAAMADAYAWLPGMEALLARLVANGYELHAFSNYPDWWRLIEERLALSRYLKWSAVSCLPAMRAARKPEATAFVAAAEAAAAGAAPEDLLLIVRALLRASDVVPTRLMVCFAVHVRCATAGRPFGERGGGARRRLVRRPVHGRSGARGGAARPRRGVVTGVTAMLRLACSAGHAVRGVLPLVPLQMLPE